MPKPRDERFRAFADSLPVPLRLLTPAGRAVWFNSPWLSFIGRSARELMGDGWTNVVHPEEASSCLATVATAATGGLPFSLDYRLQRADGEFRWVTETAIPASGSSGTVTGYVCSMTDVTEAKLAEARLRAAEDDKARFLAAVGYAIQSRLAPAADALDLLDGSIPQVKRRRVRAVVREQIEHARVLAGDFLDVSQIALGKIQLHLERASMQAILERVIATVRPTLDSVRQKVIMRLPAASVSVIADEARLFQAFALLIRFASELTPEGRKISIFHTLTTEIILIHIRDSGRGLAQERLAGLFDLFAQREPSRRGVSPELGMALFTARRLIELHGGTVQIANVEPAGGLLLTARIRLAPDNGQGAIWAGNSGGPQQVPQNSTT
ncbi:MAG: PAS domain-containing sensor histidine kinase [Planctomycetes bacterium]|nr:PAS domain-containing sensor histidine kinase [Planctomycetota bacterium]